MDGRYLTNSINNLTKSSFGDGGQIIVTAGKDSPVGLEMTWCYALTDITGFTAESSKLSPLGGGFPTDLLAGMELPSGIYNIHVTSGSLMCFYN